MTATVAAVAAVAAADDAAADAACVTPREPNKCPHSHDRRSDCCC